MIYSGKRLAKQKFCIIIAKFRNIFAVFNNMNFRTKRNHEVIFVNPIFWMFLGNRQRKLRQTKFLLFNFWVIKLTNTPILPNCQVPNDLFGISVNSILQFLKNVFNFRPNAGAEPGVFRICISNEAGFLLKIHIYKVIYLRN